MNFKGILKNLKLSEQNISMVLGALVVVVIGILIFNYFRGATKQGTVTTPTETEQPGEVKLIEEDGKMVPEGLPTIHKVEKGENLWQIAEKYFGSGYNWVDIANENKLTNANRLLVGQELNIPKAEVKKPAVEEKVAAQTDGSIEGSTYTVVKGDNLWEIAVRAYQDGYRWTEIAEANQLTNPDIIHQGNTLTIPR